MRSRRAPRERASSASSPRACRRCARPSSPSGRNTPVPARILLIEDNAETARLLARAFGAAGDPFEVTAVYSARDGLPHLAEHPVDCVLLDYRLPDADRLECPRQIPHGPPHVPGGMITRAGS